MFSLKINECKTLGVTIDKHLSWKSNTENTLGIFSSAGRRSFYRKLVTSLFVFYLPHFPLNKVIKEFRHYKDKCLIDRVIHELQDDTNIAMVMRYVLMLASFFFKAF